MTGLLLTGVHRVYATGGGGGGGPSYEQIKYQFFAASGSFPGVTTTSTLAVDIAADATFQESGSNTASTVWWVSTQGTSTNDLLIFHVGWDDSTTITDCSSSTLPSGQSLSTLLNTVASQNTEVRSKVFWAIATTSFAATSVRFNPVPTNSTETRTAVVMRIPAGKYNSSDPLGSKSTYNANASTSASVSSPSFSATTSDILGRLIAFNVIDTDPLTGTPAGWQSTSALDLGDVTHGLSYRTSTVAASESIPSYNWTIAGDSSVTHAYILKSYTSTVDIGRSSLAAVNTSTTLIGDEIYGVQVRVQNTVSSGTDAFKWQYKHVEGTNTWTDISDTSNVVSAVTTADFSHGDDVPEYLTGSGTYEANNNAGLTTSGTLTLGSVMSSSSAYESHLNFQLIDADVSGNDTVQMRIVLGDDSALNTYTQTPTFIKSAGIPVSTRVLLVSSAVFNGSSVGTTASVTTTANEVVYFVIGAHAAAGPVSDNIFTVSSAGLTWVRVEENPDPGRRTVGIFRAFSSVSTSGVITVTEGGAQDFSFRDFTYGVIQFQNSNTGGANGSGATGTPAVSSINGTSLGISISGTPGTNDATFGAVFLADSATSINSDALWDRVSSFALADGTLVIDWDAGKDQSPTWTWTGTADASAIGYIVIAA